MEIRDDQSTPTKAPVPFVCPPSPSSSIMAMLFSRLFSQWTFIHSICSSSVGNTLHKSIQTTKRKRERRMNSRRRKRKVKCRSSSSHCLDGWETEKERRSEKARYWQNQSALFVYSTFTSSSNWNWFLFIVMPHGRKCFHATWISFQSKWKMKTDGEKREREKRETRRWRREWGITVTTGEILVSLSSW